MLRHSHVMLVTSFPRKYLLRHSHVMLVISLKEEKQKQSWQQLMKTSAKKPWKWQAIHTRKVVWQGAQIYSRRLWELVDAHKMQEHRGRHKTDEQGRPFFLHCQLAWLSWEVCSICLYNRVYAPFFWSNSSWVPDSTTDKEWGSMTQILSAFRIVDKRWAITTTVLCFINFSNASWTTASDSSTKY